MESFTFHNKKTKLFKSSTLKAKTALSNSPIYDQFQSQSARVLALPWEQAHQDDLNDICELRVSFPVLRIKMNLD